MKEFREWFWLFIVNQALLSLFYFFKFDFPLKFIHTFEGLTFFSLQNSFIYTRFQFQTYAS